MFEEKVLNYWSHGPHYQFKDSIIFITWRLAFTLPQHIIRMFDEIRKGPDDKTKQWTKEQLEEHNAYLFKMFIEYDTALASVKHPDISLNTPEYAKIIRDAFHYFDAERYELHAYCIMSNHIHLLIRPLSKGEGVFYHLPDIVYSLKRFTCNQINKLRGTHGQFWDNYYFDRIIRNYKNYSNVVEYILANPVKAGLVKSAEEWRDSYHNSELR